ncbi:MAG: hypothetical protein LUC88_07970 [Prevotella sp.]|nr:hypothetical protein [Prevotella sp.]
MVKIPPPKILLEDYVIRDSKIDMEEVRLSVADSEGNPQEIMKKVPGKTLAIRFKRIIRTFTNGDDETYMFMKKRDANGEPTEEDAEFYAFTGSKILIDQATRDFSPEDLPCPTIIQQFTSKDNKTFFKFT